MNLEFSIIGLTRNKITLVDIEDYDWLSKWKWQATEHNRVRGKCGEHYNGKRKLVYMAREILEVTNPKLYVDHINHNTLDNRKCNLRICTRNQNNQNRKLNKNNSSEFKGVYFKKQRKKWCVQIMKNCKNKHIGYFNNKIDAAKAYNQAAKNFYGEFAYLNKI